MDKDSFYFSSENLDLLYGLLKNDIINKFNLNIDNKKNHYKTKLFGVMSKIHINNKTKSIKELNQLVLKNAAPDFINSIKPTEGLLRDSGIIDGSYDLMKKTTVDIRPKSSNTNTNTYISNDLDKMKTERDKLEGRPVNNPNMFKEEKDETQNLEEMEQEFLKRNNELKDSTSIESQSPSPFKSEIFEEKVEMGTNNFEITDNISEKDTSNKRNQTLLNSFIMNNNADPNEIHKRNMEDFSELDKHFKNQTSVKENPLDLLIPTTNIKYVEKQNIVTISSVDRDWTNTDNTRYSYSVFFNAANDSTEIVKTRV